MNENRTTLLLITKCTIVSAIVSGVIGILTYQSMNRIVNEKLKKADETLESVYLSGILDGKELQREERQ
jgi:hypothetical protein